MQEKDAVFYVGNAPGTDNGIITKKRFKKRCIY